MSVTQHNANVPLGAFVRSLLIDVIPAASILFLLVIASLPLGIPSVLRTGALLPLIGVSYWSLVRPRAMGLTLVFVLGLIADCVLFAPLGANAFIFVASQAILSRQRRFLVGQGFWVLWSAFALLVLGAQAAQWLIAAAFTAVTLPFFPSLLGACLAWACMPILAGLLSLLHSVMDLFDEPIA